jgi:hypothetical protein
LRRDLLAAIREAVDAAQATAAAVQATPEQGRYSAERPEPPHGMRRDRELAHIPYPEAGRMSVSSEPAPRRWGQERGYAWVEDEPSPPWWRRIFGRDY